MPRRSDEGSVSELNHVQIPRRDQVAGFLLLLFFALVSITALALAVEARLQISAVRSDLEANLKIGAEFSAFRDEWRQSETREDQRLSELQERLGRCEQRFGD